MEWDEIAEYVRPYVVKIETPSGHGTGFVCTYDFTKLRCGIATANHVIATAVKWHQPMIISHFSSGNEILINASDRQVYTDHETDSAVIMMQSDLLPFPDEPIPFMPEDATLPLGSTVGWLGYPGGLLATSSLLCFFSGVVSARYEQRHAHLIDGVAISGVSGGPVVYSHPVEGVQIIGIISAYVPNRATGETLPGLSVAQDVSHFLKTLLLIKSEGDQLMKQIAEGIEE